MEPNLFLAPIQTWIPFCCSCRTIPAGGMSRGKKKEKNSFDEQVCMSGGACESVRERILGCAGACVSSYQVAYLPPERGAHERNNERGTCLSTSRTPLQRGCDLEPAYGRYADHKIIKRILVFPFLSGEGAG